MSVWRTLPESFYRRPSQAVARDLIGRYLVRESRGARQVLRLVEVEAYLGPQDPAAHTFGGRRTERVRSMYLGGGHAYVYRIYGMHFCFNVVCGEADSGAAVLVRAGEAVEGAEAMIRRRGVGPDPRPGQIAGGPGKLCRALAIDHRLDGASLLRGPLRVVEGEAVADDEVAVGARIGVDYAGEAAGWPLRFALRSSKDVSRPRRR